MAHVYTTTSLKSKVEVRLMERTVHSGLRFVIFRNGMIVSECDNIGDAYREYNRVAAD